MFIYPKRDTHYDTGRRQGGGRLQVSNNAHARAYAHGPAHAPCKCDKSEHSDLTGIRLGTKDSC